MKIYKITEASDYLGGINKHSQDACQQRKETIVDANKKLVKGVKDGPNTISE